MAIISRGRPAAVRPEQRQAAPLAPGLATSTTARYAWAVTRILMAWIFLWAFLDKLFGFGFATPAGKGWVDGGSPTKGFLSGSTGPFKGFYTSIAGAGWANALFMIGLVAIGLALLLGIGMRIAAGAGVVLLVMMYTVVLPPETNPVIDDHIVLAAVLIGLAATYAGDTLGLGGWWGRQNLVKRFPVLR